MLNIFEVLGLDEEDLAWQALATCTGWDTNDFHENYESNERVARAIDQMCLSCPVMVQCLQNGMDNGEYGVWGGIYLTAGNTDANKNSHKTKHVWQELSERIGDAGN